MKTHPDSIFFESNDVSEAVESGVSTECLIMTDPSGLLDAVEFVPASAYLEAIRERDEARKLANDATLKMLQQNPLVDEEES